MISTHISLLTAPWPVVLFYSFFLLRFFSLLISIRNQKRLEQMGATEIGKFNSAILTAAHCCYYAACLTEGYLKGAFFSDSLTLTGLWIYIPSIIMLYYVIYSLRHVWTVKLILAPRYYHKINRSFLFRYIKHPNYYLNIIPELIGAGLIFHAWYTLFIGLPLYLVPLIIRIRQEETAMKRYFGV